MRATYLVVLSIFAFAACGENSKSTVVGESVENPQIETAEAPAETASVQAESDLATGLPRPSCPATVDIAKYRGPDVAGLKLGMTRAEAMGVAYCSRQDFEVRASGQLLDVRTYEIDLGPQVVIMQNGAREACDRLRPAATGECSSVGQRIGSTSEMVNNTEKLELWTPGLPNQEKLLGLWRVQKFPEDRPAVEATTAALVAKYGEPIIWDSKEVSVKNGAMGLVWVYDGDAAPVSKGSPLANCHATLAPISAENSRWSSGCDVTLKVVLYLADNPDLVRTMAVAMFDQNGLIEAGEEMQAGADTAHKQFQASELEKSKASGVVPDL